MDARDMGTGNTEGDPVPDFLIRPQYKKAGRTSICPPSFHSTKITNAY